MTEIQIKIYIVMAVLVTAIHELFPLGKCWIARHMDDRNESGHDGEY